MFEIKLDNWTLTPELALMLDIVLRKAPQIPAELSWDAFDAAVRQHRVQPLLIRGLRGMDTDAVPTLQKYRGRQNKYTAESLQRLQALVQVSNALAGEGIRMISMKGPLLSMELYGDPSLRTSRDLDVMVPQEDMARAGEILESLGYAPEQNPCHKTPLRRRYYSFVEHEKHMVYNKGSICLELHWKSNFQSEDTFDGLWQRREKQLVLGSRIAVMGMEDRYPALIIHAAEHGFHRLRWLLDLYELQKKPHFRWETLYRQLSEKGLGELLLETAIVMYRMPLPGLEELHFDGVSLTRTPNGICLQLRDDLAEQGRRAVALSEAACPMWFSETKFADPRQRVYDRLLPVQLIHKSALQKLLLATGPSMHELKLVDLPDWLFWLYFLIRPVHWLYRKLFGK